MSQHYGSNKRNRILYKTVTRQATNIQSRSANVPGFKNKILQIYFILFSPTSASGALRHLEEIKGMGYLSLKIQKSKSCLLFHTR